MKRYICNDDVIILKKKLATSGAVIEIGDELKSECGSIKFKFDEDFISNFSDLFSPIPDINIESKELSESDESQIKDWIIQLKITTSRKKLRQIENFIKLNIEKLL